jgi:hypothetical protein
LFRLVPVKGLQARIIRNHFRTCPSCAKEIEVVEDVEDDAIKEVIFSPARFENLDSMVPGVEDRIRQMRKAGAKTVKQPILFPRLRWAMAGAAAAVIIILVLTFFPRTDSGPLTDTHVKPKEQDVFVHYIKTRNNYARTFIIKEKKANRTFIWFEKHET